MPKTTTSFLDGDVSYDAPNPRVEAHETNKGKSKIGGWTGDMKQDDVYGGAASA